MSDLDTRLRNLKQPTVDGPSASVLRERATRHVGGDVVDSKPEPSSRPPSVLA